MSNSMRSALAGYNYNELVHKAHIGLWFDRYLEEQARGEGGHNASLVRKCSRINEPELYAAFFARWVEGLDRLGVRPRTAKVVYRLAAGHGGESVIETSIRLHHTYGVPIIPGSSLKGVAASFADRVLGGKRSWEKGSEAYNAFFGTTAESGCLTFFDALPLPGQWELLPDVLTVHHPDYYTGSGSAPADWDSPNPVSFLAARGTFLIGLGVSDATWAEMGYELLRQALREQGVGGKTSSGYGRMELSQTPLPRLEVGAVVRTIVGRVVGGDVELSLNEPRLMGIPPGVELNVYVPHEHWGNYQWVAGREVRCVVLSLIEDRDEEPPVLNVSCRRAKQEDR